MGISWGATTIRQVGERAKSRRVTDGVYGMHLMADYDLHDPATWLDSDAVDCREIARRVAVLPGYVPHSEAYIRRNLTHRPDWPRAGGWTLNNGRWWYWADVRAWFIATGRTNRATRPTAG